MLYSFCYRTCRARSRACGTYWDSPFPLKHSRSPLSAELENLVTLRVERWNSTPRFALVPERGSEYIKYFILPSGNRTHNLSPFQSHFCAPRPRLRLIKSNQISSDLIFQLNQPHAVSRMHWGRHREPSLRKPISHFPLNFPECWVAELNAGLLPWSQSEVFL